MKKLVQRIMLLAVCFGILAPAPLAHADDWLLRCGWDANIQAWTCVTVWWPYYKHLTTQPDFCPADPAKRWKNGDRVWMKWDANYQNVISWYGVPADDLTTQAPAGYEQHNFTVTGANDGPPCNLTP